MDREKVLSTIANPSKMFTDEWNDAYNELCDYTWKYRWHDLRKNPNDLPHPHDDSEFYDCVVENHEHDLVYPAYQYSEEYEAFGFYQNRLDPVSLGYADCEFKTVEELGHEKVIAWREIELFEEEE